MLDQSVVSTIKDIRDSSGIAKAGKRISDFSHVAGMVRGLGRRLPIRLSGERRSPMARVPKKY